MVGAAIVIRENPPAHPDLARGRARALSLSKWPDRDDDGLLPTRANLRRDARGRAFTVRAANRRVRIVEVGSGKLVRAEFTLSPRTRHVCLNDDSHGSNANAADEEDLAILCHDLFVSARALDGEAAGYSAHARLAARCEAPTSRRSSDSRRPRVSPLCTTCAARSWHTPPACLPARAAATRSLGFVSAPTARRQRRDRRARRGVPLG